VGLQEQDEDIMADDLLSGFPVVVEYPVAWGEMDAFGHVNNIVYFRYFEHSRLAYCLRLGFKSVPQNEIGPILAAVECRFRKPLTYPDTVRIGARITTVLEDRVTMEHRVVSLGQNAVVAEGKGIIVTFDYGAGRKTAIPDEVRKRIAEVEGTSSP
jgi:acyl-CoA thioester hydrolase